MSVMGQKRKPGDAIATSDFLPKAVIKRTWRDVRKVPIPEVAVSPSAVDRLSCTIFVSGAWQRRVFSLPVLAARCAHTWH